MGAVFVSRFLSELLFEVQPLDVATYVIVGATLLPGGRKAHGKYRQEPLAQRVETSTHPAIRPETTAHI